MNLPSVHFNKTEQPTLCKSGICDVSDLFVSDILFTNLVQRSYIVQQLTSCLHHVSLMRDCIWRNKHTSELCVYCPPSQDPTCCFYKLPYTPITARVHCTACMFVQRENLITSSTGPQGSESSRELKTTGRDVHLQSWVFMGLKTYMALKCPKAVRNYLAEGKVAPFTGLHLESKRLMTCSKLNLIWEVSP